MKGNRREIDGNTRARKEIEGKIMPVLFVSSTGCIFNLWTFNTVCQG